VLRKNPLLVLRSSLLLLAAIVALAGCGGDEADARGADGRVAIVLDDFRYRPQTIRARPGRLTVELSSRGRLGHNFNLRKGGRTVATVKTLKPGVRRTAAIDLTRGDYRMFCSIANHEELGMYGAITVR
jgi:plastocyanin